jgi:copper(I)-binding protein
MNWLTRIILSLSLLFGTAAQAADGLMIADAWVREGPPTARVLAGYLRLMNHSDAPITIHGVESEAFGRVEMHRTVVEDGVARMLPQDSLTVPAHGELVLEPGGYHLMLIEARTPLRAGDQVTLTLDLGDAGHQELSLPVRKGEPGMNGMDHGQMHHDHMHMQH